VVLSACFLVFGKQPTATPSHKDLQSGNVKWVYRFLYVLFQEGAYIASLAMCSMRLVKSYRKGNSDVREIMFFYFIVSVFGTCERCCVFPTSADMWLSLILSCKPVSKADAAKGKSYEMLYC
jgi:hypothetical protein